MYTIDDQSNDTYENEEYVSSGWDNNKGLIFKIIIIILCIIVLIWLVKALKSTKSVDNGEVHVANVEKVRLAAENYFFINNNKEKTSVVTLTELKNNGLIGDITDANSKTCSGNDTKVNLKTDTDAYEMTINLSCSTNDKVEKFYYHRNTLACLNCNGKTNMDGKVVIIDDDEKEEEEIIDNSDTEDDYYNDYSCVDWSDWTKERVFDSNLDERTKTLVQGVKYGKKTVFTEWSEYSTTPIEASETIEVETKTETVTEWSGNKTSSSIDPNNSNIKVISTEVISTGSYSCDYSDNGICYGELTTGNLTMKEYTSGDYKVINDRCEGVQTLLNNEGKYVLTYVNCKYYKRTNETNTGIGSYIQYTYQELETKNIVYYRFRYINTIDEADSYTDVKYEEKDLPAGYVKVPGTEETYYSYKLNTCEK